MVTRFQLEFSPGAGFGKHTFYSSVSTPPAVDEGSYAVSMKGEEYNVDIKYRMRWVPVPQMVSVYPGAHWH